MNPLKRIENMADYGFAELGLEESANMHSDAIELMAEITELQSENADLKDKLEETEDALGDAVKLFAATVEKYRWIPVSERLPNQDCHVLVLTGHNKQAFSGVYSSLRGEFCGNLGGVLYHNITHWKYIITGDAITLPDKPTSQPGG